jgi:type IV secretion system protein VirB4
MLAGNFADRPRPWDITSRNFIGFSPFHNYPSGKRDGNHWGPAVALLKTASGAPYYFSLHRHDIGHFKVYGSTGAGKTVLVMFLITQLQKFKATLLYFDKDRGAEIGIRALGGRYLALKRGEPTGLNPFAIAPTAGNIAFVQELVRVLVRSERPFTARENSEIDRAVSGVFRLDTAHRRLGSAMAYLDPPSENNIAARLLRWVHTDRGTGPMSWVFDNPHDLLNFSGAQLFGIDQTHFLDDEAARTPLMMYLNHRIEALKDGRRGGVMIDEGWKSLDDPIFENRIGDSLKTDRKKDWFLGLITQSPKDSLRSRIAHTISEQTPTTIYLPNLNARREDYVQGMGCTEGEFEVIRSLPEGGRRFVVKQGANAVIAELDLAGLPDDLSVFSGTAANLSLLDRILEEVGDDPTIWLPIFHERRKAS